MVVSAVTAFLTLSVAGIAMYVWASMQMKLPAVAIVSSEVQSDPIQATHRENAGSSDPGLLATPESTAEIVKRVASGVFFITAYDALGQSTSVGTGCRVADNLIATNRHVVENAVRVSVKQKDGTEYPVQGYCSDDMTRDLALMVVNDLPDTAHRFVAVGGASLVQGDRLTAIGHPKEFSFSVSDGIVSAIRETADFPEIYQSGLHANPDTRWIQSTAAISNGSSGGPLLNNRGELVGINTWIAGGQNLGFAIDTIHLRPLIETSNHQCHAFPFSDSSVIVTTEVALINADFEKEYDNLLSNLQSNRSAEAMRLLIRRQNPVPIYLAKCLQVVETKPNTLECWDAILMAHYIWSNYERLREGEHYLRQIYSASWNEQQLPSRVLMQLAQAPYSLELDQRLRPLLTANNSAEITATAGYVLLASMAAAEEAALTADVFALKDRLIGELGDQEVAGYPLRKWVDSVATEYGVGAVGTRAPEIEGLDFTGQPLRLSEHKNKVVLLDFWADWCPHCRNMYPMERELVEHLRDQPFALLGVNSDEAHRARSVVDSGQITWSSWVDSPPGSPIGAQWNINSYPTMFLLDQRGVVRYKMHGAEDVTTLIEFLLEESLISAPGDVLPTDADWKFHSAVDIEGNSWTLNDYDDAAWSQVKGPVAYGRQDMRDTEADWNSQIPGTVLFRSQFTLASSAATQPLIAHIRFDDAVILYVNGREVYRSNIADDGGLTTPASRMASSQHQEGQYFLIPAQYLRAGNNTIAASVHQASGHSAAMLFGATLSTHLPDKAAIFAAKSSSIAMAYCDMLSDLLPIDPHLTDLKSLLEHADPKVKVKAWLSAARGGKPLEMNWKDDPAMQQLAAHQAFQMVSESYAALKKRNLSSQDYRWCARTAYAAKSLLNAVFPDDPRMSTMADQALALAMYRTAKYTRAIELLQAKSSEETPNPTSLAYTALCYAKLNDKVKSKEFVDKFIALFKQPEWRHVELASALYEELAVHCETIVPNSESEAVIESPPEEPASVSDQVQNEGQQAKIAQRDQLWQKASDLTSTGRFNEAAEMFKSVYQIEQPVFGEVHEKVPGTLGSLLQTAEFQQNYQAVAKYRKRQ
jgi:S1-C subfamily serine protease/thiol-disulfide isomerase/thioredoxin